MDFRERECVLGMDGGIGRRVGNECDGQGRRKCVVGY